MYCSSRPQPYCARWSLHCCACNCDVWFIVLKCMQPLECALQRIFRLFREDQLGPVREALRIADGEQAGLQPVTLQDLSILGADVERAHVWIGYTLPQKLQAMAPSERVCISKAQPSSAFMAPAQLRAQATHGHNQTPAFHCS